MKKSELQFIFVNQNTPEDTVKAIKEMVIEHIVRQAEDEELNLLEKPA